MDESSKQIKLYDYITNPSRTTKSEEKINKKIKLDELQRLSHLK